jgi:hypothetical protein
MGAVDTSQQTYNQYASSVLPGPGQPMPNYQDWVQQQKSTPDPQNYMRTGLMNPSSYEQGFVNPYPDGTQQLTGPLGGGPGYVPPTQQQLDYWRTNPGQMDEGTGGGNPNMANNPYGYSIQPSGNDPGFTAGNYSNNPQLNATTNTNASGANDPVSGLYQSLLGRAPDAAGLQYFQNQLQSGKSVQDITNAIKASPEYTQRNPTATATQTNDPVSNLYQQVLGRAPDAAGLAYWNQQLKSGKSIQDIQAAMQQTPEYQQRQPQVKPNPSTAPNTNPYGITTGNQFASSTNPYIQAAQQTSLANLAGAQTATSANRVNQQTPYGSLQYTQTGTDAQGNPIWSANQSLSPQLQQLTTQSLTGLQNSLTNPAYGINPGQTYSDAIMQRLQPQQQQAQQRLDAQLANQGIMPGSEAYNRAKTLQSQSINDQLTSAIVGGMQTGLQANTAQNQTAANIKALSSPGYINPYSQAATSGPDYTGAYATSQAADIAAKNAAAAKQANLQSGLFNLGATGLLSSGGIPGLVSAGTQAYDWLSKIGGSTNPGLVLGNGSYTTSLGNVVNSSDYTNLF